MLLRCHIHSERKHITHVVLSKDLLPILDIEVIAVVLGIFTISAAIAFEHRK